MATPSLLDIVRARRAELEGDSVGISDDRRIWALMALSARAERGDQAAKATLAAVERLFGAAGLDRASPGDPGAHIVFGRGPCASAPTPPSRRKKIKNPKIKK
jgi:predicted NBD/HSP70 family sugar kinase